MEIVIGNFLSRRTNLSSHYIQLGPTKGRYLFACIDRYQGPLKMAFYPSFSIEHTYFFSHNRHRKQGLLRTNIMHLKAGGSGPATGNIKIGRASCREREQM